MGKNPHKSTHSKLGSADCIEKSLLGRKAASFPGPNPVLLPTEKVAVTKTHRSSREAFLPSAALWMKMTPADRPRFLMPQFRWPVQVAAESSKGASLQLAHYSKTHLGHDRG